MPRNVTALASPREILVVEDNPGYVRLIREALRDASVRSSVQIARDGMEAMSILQQQGKHAGANRPDLIMLDLNMPKKGGWEVLREIKLNQALKSIPVIVLTTSDSEEDIRRSYQLDANCFVTKPGDLDEFLQVVAAIDEFWLTTARLPRNHHDG